MNLVGTIALAVTLATAASPPATTASPPEKEATSAADAWLKLVDGGDYAKSWDEAAAFFKGAISKADWEKALTGVRKPLGKMLSRKVSSATFSTSLPGAPDGKYVVVKYDTSFEAKKASVETVTLILEKDGKWRVVGYLIH